MKRNIKLLFNPSMQIFLNINTFLQKVCMQDVGKDFFQSFTHEDVKKCKKQDCLEKVEYIFCIYSG